MGSSDTEFVPGQSVHKNKRKKRKKSSRDSTMEESPPQESAVCTPAMKHKMMELIQNIMRKDVHMIFAEPVSDIIAPGYSSIITHPIDLSTMQARVQRGEYISLKELKVDTDQMCKNCMVYNADDTIFYKEAVKIQNYIYMLFGEKKSKVAISSDVQEGIRKKKELQEEWRADEIHQSVKKAAADAKERLEELRPNTRVGYLSKEGDVTLLNIINAPSGEATEKTVDMSCFKPYENTATSLLHNFKEKRRVPGKPVQYLHYGPFGSFMPSYDSVFSSLDETDQQLLYRCYGDELGLSYCRSVQEFARGSSDSLRAPVDSIINSLTAGGHARANKMLAQKYVKIIRERRLTRQRRTGDQSKRGEVSGPPESTNTPAATEVTLMKEEDSLLQLLESDDIPDILNNPELQNQLEKACSDPELQEKLDETSGMIAELHGEQMTRLSQPQEGAAVWPPPVLPAEAEIAEGIKVNLTSMISNHVVAPRDVVSQESVRTAMSSEILDQVEPS